MATTPSPPLIRSYSRRRVVSFSVFGTSELYTKGAIANAILLPSIYPGWVGRFYLADDVPDQIVSMLVNMPEIEVVRFSRSEWPGRTAQVLRFFPASEPGIDAVVVRDSDSRINLREAACVSEWLSTIPPARFHLMHESMHNADYGEVMGGMWGARAIEGEGSTNCPVPGLADAAMAFKADGGKVGCEDGGKSEIFDVAAADTSRSQVSSRQRDSSLCAEYGGDMAFLRAFVTPLLSADSCVHHVDGPDKERPLGALSVPRRPFPKTPFQGFVGQPVNCACPPAAFLSTGCAHIRRSIPGELSSLVKGNSDILAALGQFLG